MLPITAIVYLILIQLTGNLILDKLNLKFWKYVMLCGILVVYIFVLPNFFMEKNAKCGLPNLGINMAFWIYGCGSALLTHLISSVVRNTLNANIK